MLQTHRPLEHAKAPGICSFFAPKVPFCREIEAGFRDGSITP
jgi:hypothetical protein